MYAQEGARAANQAELLNKALKGSAKRFLNAYKNEKTENNLQNLVDEVIRVKPELGSDDITLSEIKRYFAIRNMYEWLEENNIAKDCFSRYRKGLIDKKELINLILENNPQIRNLDKVSPETLADKLLHEKIRWENFHPKNKYNPPYINPHTRYYSTCLARNMSDSHHHLRRMSTATAGMFRRTSTSETKPTPSTPSIPVTLLKMPTFGNVIGAKIIYPPYIADAAGTLFLQNPAKAICVGINKLFGSYKKSWLATGLKVLIAGPFILGKFLTFATAKILSPSGIAELAKSDQPKVHPEVELTVRHSPKTANLTNADPVVPGPKMTSEAKVLKQISALEVKSPASRGDMKVEDFVSEATTVDMDPLKLDVVHEDDSNAASPESGSPETEKDNKSKFKL